MSWNTYYTGSQSDVIVANTQINTNCGFPRNGTTTWDTPVAAFQPNSFWYILMPPPSGYIFPDGTTIPQSTMINGVVNVTQQQSNSSWFPPPTPGPPQTTSISAVKSMDLAAKIKITPIIAPPAVIKRKEKPEDDWVIEFGVGDVPTEDEVQKQKDGLSFNLKENWITIEDNMKKDMKDGK